MMSAYSGVAGGITALAGAAAATYFLTRLPAIPPGVDLDDQSVPMTGEEHKVGGSI